MPKAANKEEIRNRETRYLSREIRPKKTIQAKWKKKQGGRKTTPDWAKSGKKETRVVLTIGTSLIPNLWCKMHDGQQKAASGQPKNPGLPSSSCLVLALSYKSTLAQPRCTNNNMFRICFFFSQPKISFLVNPKKNNIGGTPATTNLSFPFGKKMLRGLFVQNKVFLDSNPGW